MKKSPYKPLVRSLTQTMMEWHQEWYEKRPEPPPVDAGKVVQFDDFARAMEKQKTERNPE